MAHDIATDSSIDTSRRSPIPVSLAWCLAVNTPTAAKVAVAHSLMSPPARIGGLLASPRYPIPPAHACSVRSLAALSAHGPSSPKGVIAQTTALGLRLDSRDGLGCSSVNFSNPANGHLHDVSSIRLGLTCSVLMDQYAADVAPGVYVPVALVDLVQAGGREPS